MCKKIKLINTDELMRNKKKQLEVLREHRPPPNASIIELWQFFPDPDRDPEWTPGSDSDADRHQNVISWSLL